MKSHTPPPHDFKNEKSVVCVFFTPASASAAAGMMSDRNAHLWCLFELAALPGLARHWTRMFPSEQQPVVGNHRCNRRLFLNGLPCNWRAAGNDKTTPHTRREPARTPLHFTLISFRRRSAVSTSSAAVAVLLLAVSIMLQNHTAVATVSVGERSALVDLWNSVSGMSDAFPDWNAGDPCANGWSGVSCSEAPAVTYVELCPPPRTSVGGS